MTIQKIFEDILVECELRHPHIHGQTDDDYRAKLNADPIYILASQGLRIAVGGPNE